MEWQKFNNNYLPILLDCINENISPGVFTMSACVYMCVYVCVRVCVCVGKKVK